MAVPWSLTRAAVKLSLFQDIDLSYSTPHRPVMANLLQTECLNRNPKLTYVFQSANTAF